MAKQLSCRDAGMDCDFMIRSEDEDELIDFAKEHLQKAHDTQMSGADIRGAWETV
jgi:predicted small metal-binding protein